MSINAIFSLAFLSMLILYPGRAGIDTLLISMAAACVMATLAYQLKWLAKSGLLSSFIMGTIIFTLGGWASAILLLVFFISSSLVSIKKDENITASQSITEDEASIDDGRQRNGRQVWSNGFWFTIFTMLYFSMADTILAVSAFSAIACATSDTWASELGSRRFPAKTFLITNGKEVKPGEDGGISWPGLGAGLIGSSVIAATAYLVVLTDYKLALTIFAAGFLGCLVDSYFGAKFQSSIANKFKANSGTQSFTVDNDIVNWLSTGVASLIPITLKLFSA